MALFKRKSDQSVLPEIERYYDAEKRERAGLAWLLALASIACVALLLIGLFYSGHWLYRKTIHTGGKVGVSTSGISNSTNKTIGGSKKNTTPKTTAPSKPTPQTPAPTSATPKVPTDLKVPALTTPAPSAPTNPPNNLANTGPSSTVAIFIGSVLGFTALHNVFSRTRRSN